MNFAAIGPLSVSGIFENHSHHMALAQYLWDPEYFDFYRGLVSRGKRVILDSGVYEGAEVSTRALLYYCRVLQPWAVILPDKPHDALETMKRSMSFAEKVRPTCLELKLLKVLHAAPGSFNTFISSYMSDSRLFDGVCFSRLTEHYGVSSVESKYFPRPYFIQYLQENKLWNSRCYHHALGMHNGSLNELKQLRELGIDSCDSSAPIWRPLNQGYGLQNSPSDFDIPFDPFAQPGVDWKDEYGEVAERSFKQVVQLCA